MKTKMINLKKICKGEMKMKRLIIILSMILSLLCISKQHAFAATAWSWGSNSSGQLGDLSTTDRYTPVRVIRAYYPEGGIFYLTGIVAVEGGAEHSLALKDDGTVWAWGSNGTGQLGNGWYEDSDQYLPVQVQGLTNVVAIAARGYHSLALTRDGRVYAWGLCLYGQLGYVLQGQWCDPEAGFAIRIPNSVSDLTDVVAIAAGDNHSLALTRDGTVWAWGRNDSGQLGINTSDPYKTRPVQVYQSSGLTEAIAIAAGGRHSLAIKSDGTVWAWGSNSYGQLGIDEPVNTNFTYPRQVMVDAFGYTPLTGVEAIAAGGNHSLAKKRDGTVWAWGYNFYGQLGNNSRYDNNAAVQVRGANGSGFLTGARAIAAGANHSLALKSDGTVWSWGRKHHGQLGNGTQSNPGSGETVQITPVQVRGLNGSGFLTSVIAIAAGWDHSLAISAADLIVNTLITPLFAAPEQSITLSDRTRNQGTDTAGASTTRFYWSTNSTYDSGDRYLGFRSIPSLGAGAMNTGSISVTVPPWTCSGTYYIIAKADADGVVTEGNETNNTRNRAIRVGTDLIISTLLTPNISGSGNSITLMDTTRNEGGCTAGGSTTRFYLSTNSTWDTGDTYLGERSVPSLLPGTSNFGSIILTFPIAPPGVYYLIARADATLAVFETSETNNIRANRIWIGPDLIISALSAPMSAGRGTTITITDTTMNNGGGRAGSNSRTCFYLSTDATWDASDMSLGCRSVQGLAAGETNTGSISLSIPTWASPGTYNIIAKADADHAVAESIETNNNRNRSITVQ